MLDKILVIGIFLGLTLPFTLFLLWLVNKTNSKYRLYKKSKNKIGKKYYVPALIGGSVGFAIAGDFVWSLFAALLGSTLGLIGHMVFQRMYHSFAQERKTGETLMLYEIISIYSEAGHSLYEALDAGKYLTKTIRQPLDRCLSRWSFGPNTALQKFGEEVGVVESRALSRVLQRALVVGPGRLTEFLNKEGKTMEELRQYRIEQGLSARPLVQTLFLVFPGLALIGVTLVPLGYHIQKSLMSIKLG